MDTNVLITLTARYPAEIFPTLWSNIDFLIEAERFLVPEQVARENQDEGTKRWLAARAQIVRPFDVPSNECLRRVMAELPNFVDPAKTTPEADQFLVALAMAENVRIHDGAVSGCVAVVSCERHRRPNDPRLRVPDACAHFGIDCYNLLPFMANEGWQF